MELKKMAEEEKEPSTFKSLMLPLAISVAFLVGSLLMYASIPNKWPPPWHFGAVPDVPGESPYSSFGSKAFFGIGPAELDVILPTKQHVMGRGVEPGVVHQRPEP